MKNQNYWKFFLGVVLFIALGVAISCTRNLAPTTGLINTPTPTRTMTPTRTNTPMGPTATPTASNTPCGYPGNTCTPTNTPMGPTATPTSTPNPNFLYEDWDANNGNYAFGNPWAGTPPGYMYGFYSGGTATVNVTNDASVYHDGANSLSASVTFLNDNAGVGGLAEFILRSGHAGYGVNYTSMSAQPAYLSIWVRSSQPITFKAFIYGTTSFYTNTNSANGPVTPLTISTPNQWTNFALPVTGSCWDASFGSVDWTNFAAVGMDFTGPIGGSFPYQVTLNLDDIHFYP